MAFGTSRSKVALSISGCQDVIHTIAQQVDPRRTPHVTFYEISKLSITSRLCCEIWQMFLKLKTSYAKATLGAILAGESKFGEAEPFLLEAQQELVGAKSAPMANRVDPFLSLIALYKIWNKPYAAGKWTAELDKFEHTNGPSAMQPATRPSA